jgi:hypothetical protein
MDDPATLYLDLLKRCLTHWIYGDTENEDIDPRPLLRSEALVSGLAPGVRVIRHKPFDPQQRTMGLDWPPSAHTMIGLKRLDNIQYCIEDVLRRGVQGDLIETGVWRGGATIFMRAVLKVYGVTDRRVWVADSFAGLPPPDPHKYPADAGLNFHTCPILAVSLEQVKANFERYGLLDAQVVFLKGWFRDTLPACPVQRLAVLRLDGDLYESTTDALVHLYPKLSVGGYVIVDDYGLIPACRQAVHDFRGRHRILEPIQPIDGAGIFWQRGA